MISRLFGQILRVPLLRNVMLLVVEKVFLKNMDKEWVRVSCYSLIDNLPRQSSLEPPNETTLYSHVRQLYQADFRRNKGFKRFDFITSNDINACHFAGRC